MRDIQSEKISNLRLIDQNVFIFSVLPLYASGYYMKCFIKFFSNTFNKHLKKFQSALMLFYIFDNCIQLIPEPGKILRFK